MMNLRDKLGIPGPKPNYFFGNILEMSECFKKVKHIFFAKHNFYNFQKNFIARTNQSIVREMEKRIWERFWVR